MPRELHELLTEEHLERHAAGTDHLCGQERRPVRITMIAAQGRARLGAARIPRLPAVVRLEPQLVGEHIQIFARMPDTQRDNVTKSACGQNLADMTRAHCPLPRCPSRTSAEG